MTAPAPGDGAIARSPDTGRPLRILVHHRIASRDGQAVHLEELCHAFRQIGFPILVVGPSGFAQSEFGSTNSLVQRLKDSMPQAVFELLEIGHNLVSLVRLARNAHRFKPDVIYERFNLYLVSGILFARAARLPILLEVNSPLYEERLANGGLALKRIGRLFQRFIWAKADTTLPVTHVLKRVIAGTGVPEGTIHVIPNGIRHEQFARFASATRGAVENTAAVVIGFVGFIRDWNEVHRLVDFVASLDEASDVHLTIVGDGPGRAALEAHVAATGTQARVTITGLVSRAAIIDHLAAMDITVLPGVTDYSSPLKLFEYLALGKAILAPDMANIREILTHDENALLFDAADPASLGRMLATLVASPEKRAALGVAARDTIDRQGLTWENNARRVTTIAGDLLAASHAKARDPS